MKIYLGADHNGHMLKNEVSAYLKKRGHEVIDVSQGAKDPGDDFPVEAQELVQAMLAGDEKQPVGILLCGSGQGVCMAANRFKGIRACLGYDKESVRSARNDDDANVLCLPARHLKKDTTYALVDTFLHTPFEGLARYKRRIRELDEL